jgi:hypothetical protein
VAASLDPRATRGHQKSRRAATKRHPHDATVLILHSPEMDVLVWKKRVETSQLAFGWCEDHKNVAFGARDEAWRPAGSSATPSSPLCPNPDAFWLSDIHQTGMAWKHRSPKVFYRDDEIPDTTTRPYFPPKTPQGYQARNALAAMCKASQSP